MNWFLPIDLYCERTNVAFWAEPFNAISNIAFLLAALWAAIELRKRRTYDPLATLLMVLAAAVSAGSFLFHTFANRWAELADIIPIWTFVTVYVVACILRLRRTQASPTRVAGLVLLAAIAPALWIVSSQTTPAPAGLRDPFNGSLQYAPALVALAGFAIMLARRRHALTPWIGAAAVTFAVALVFRTVDLAICPALPTGTHFVWHLLMGSMVGLLLQAVLRFDARG